MQIKLLCVGKLKEPAMRELCAEYTKRLGRYARVEVVEVADEPLPDLRAATVQRALAREGERLLPHLARAHGIALAIDGAQHTSEGFARRIAQAQMQGETLAFVIGGSCGLDAAVLRACGERLSLSRMTMPHNLARLVLLEQLYRAFKINAGETYHK